jgi:hypothetical protein
MSGKKKSSLKVVKRIISTSILGHSKLISRSLRHFQDKMGAGKRHFVIYFIFRQNAKE